MSIFSKLFKCSSKANSDAEQVFIDYIKATAKEIDAFVVKEPGRQRKLILLCAEKLSLPGNDAELDREYCGVMEILKTHYDESIMGVVEKIVSKMLEVEIRTLNLFKAVKCEKVSSFISEHAGINKGTGLEALCDVLSPYLVIMAESGSKHNASNRHDKLDDTEFICSMEVGVELGEELLAGIRNKFVFDPRLLFDCVHFGVLIRKEVNDDLSDASEAVIESHTKLIEILKEKRSQWLEQIESAECRRQVECAVEKLIPLAYKCLLLYFSEKHDSGINKLLNEKYMSEHPDVEGNSFRYSLYNVLQYPGIEAAYTHERVQKELKF